MGVLESHKRRTVRRSLAAGIVVALLAGCGTAASPQASVSESAPASAAGSEVPLVSAQPTDVALGGEAADYLAYLATGADCEEPAPAQHGYYQAVCHAASGPIEDTITVTLTPLAVREVAYESVDTSGEAFASITADQFAGNVIGSTDPFFGSDAESMFASFRDAMGYGFNSGFTVTNQVSGASIEFSKLPNAEEDENTRLFTITPGPDGLGS